MVAAFCFLASPAGSPSFREPVSGRPRAHDGASTLAPAWAERLLAAPLLPQGSVSARPPAHDGASTRASAWAGRPLAAPFLSRGSVWAWPRAHDEASTRASAWAERLLAVPLLSRGLVSASLGSLDRHAGLARVSLVASSPESGTRRGQESQKHAV